MEKQNYQERDFNLVAKILLGLSMITTGMTIFSSMLKFGYIEYANVTVASLIIEIVLDVLILIAGFAVFLKHRWGLIALTALFVIRMFATIPLDSTMYSYQLGGNMVHFFRDFGLFAIAMCFKKNGVSGWRAMLSSKIKDIISTTEDSNIESVIKQDCIENTSDDTKETSDRIQEEEVLTQNTTRNDEVDAIEEQSPVITNPTVENKKEIDFVGTKNANYPKRRIKRGIVALIILSLIFIGGSIGFIIYVNSQEYPKGIEGFSNKFKYSFSIPNNELSKSYFDKYQKASDAGLNDLSVEFLEMAWNATPNDITILNNIGDAFFSLRHSVSNEDLRKEYYNEAEKAFLKILKVEPENKNATTQLTKIYYNTEKYDKAKRYAEQILFENPEDGFALNVLCRIAYKDEDWDNLRQWGEKGYNIECNEEHRIDCVYLYAKALYEKGYEINAMIFYTEAEKEDPSNLYHLEFQKIGGIPCKVTSLTVENRYYSGKTIDKAGETIHEDNTCFLGPVLTIETSRKGNFKFDVKLYEYKKERYYDYERHDYYNRYSWELSHNSAISPSGYTYSSDVELYGEEQKSIKLGSWGSETPGTWKKGKYRFEIWWEGEMLYSKIFNIY